MSRLRRSKGFTLIELMVVMAIIATLLTIALPRYIGSVERSKEATLKQSLSVMREAIDKFYADNGRYPDEIAELERLRYIRAVPVDPMTGNAETWVIVAPPSATSVKGSVFDLRSGSDAKGSDGTAVSGW